MKSESLTTIIFDLDGTLCKYKIDLEKSLLQCFEVDDTEELPFYATDYQEEFKRQFAQEIAGRIERPELSFRKRLFWSLLEDNDDYNRTKIIKYADRFDELRKNILVLYPEVPDTLEKLKDKFKLGMLTNGPSNLQWGKVRQLEIEHFFDTVVVSGDHGLLKPDPRIFHLTLDNLNSTNKQSLYVGNSIEHDIMGATNAGIPVIWRDNGETELTNEDPDPDYVIDNLANILDLEITKKVDSNDSRRIKIS